MILFEIKERMENVEEKLRRLQLTELEILIKIDDFCKENNIMYSLYGGTLLGAVRHNGFIPWDDDLDICMLRRDYQKFVTLWKLKKPNGYILQNKDTDETFTQSFTKIRKDHTTFLQKEDIPVKYHTGIFVDIFPIDRIPNNSLSRIHFYIRSLFFQLYTREFVPQNSQVILKLGSTFFLKLSSKKHRQKIRNRLFEKIIKYNTNDDFQLVGIETVATIRQLLPSDLFESIDYLSFEGKKFMCISKWDEYLKIKYGDYLKLPPENERIWKHHPLAIEFEKNWGEV